MADDTAAMVKRIQACFEVVEAELRDRYAALQSEHEAEIARLECEVENQFDQLTAANALLDELIADGETIVRASIITRAKELRGKP